MNRIKGQKSLLFGRLNGGKFKQTDLVEADLSVVDLEDGVSVGLVLLDALVRLLAVLGQLHS